MNDAMVYISLGVMVIICVGFGVLILNAIKPIQQQLNQSNQQVVALQQQVVNQQQTLNAIKPIQQQLNQSNQQVVALQQQVVNQQQTFQQSMTLISALSETIKTNEKSMGYFNHNINQFNKVLNDKKVRGVFGEAQLENIYASIFGVNSNMYAMQYHLPNNTIVDSVIRMPGSDALLCVDAKFPLENYNKMMEYDLKSDAYNQALKTFKQDIKIIRMPGSDALLCVDAKFPLENYNKMMEYDLKSDAYNQALKTFKQDIKIKINSIAEKYIIDGFTCDYALMFIPSVSVYDTIVEYCIDCMEYAFAHHVMLVSPINLMISVEMMSKWQRLAAQHDYADAIVDQLKDLNQEFILFKTRSAQIEKDCNKLVTDYHALMVTSQKISRRFDAILNLEE